MKKYETYKGVVTVELDKHNRPVFQIPVGMYGEIWIIERNKIIAMLKKDFPDVKLCKKKQNHA